MAALSVEIADKLSSESTPRQFASLRHDATTWGIVAPYLDKLVKARKPGLKDKKRRYWIKKLLTLARLLCCTDEGVPRSYQEQALHLPKIGYCFVLKCTDKLDPRYESYVRAYRNMMRIAVLLEIDYLFINHRWRDDGSLVSKLAWWCGLYLD